MAISFGRNDDNGNIKNAQLTILSSNQYSLLNEMNYVANECLNLLGIIANFITVMPTDRNITPVAGTLGICIEKNWFFDTKTAYGIIFVNLDIMAHLDHAERVFVISHECAHIFHNHLIATIKVNMPNLSLKVLDLFAINPTKYFLTF